MSTVVIPDTACLTLTAGGEFVGCRLGSGAGSDGLLRKTRICDRQAKDEPEQDTGQARASMGHRRPTTSLGFRPASTAR